MTAVLDIGALADCLIGYYEGKADEDILDKYAEIRREKFLRYVDARSLKNMHRINKSDPHTVLETDKFLGILRDLEGDSEGTKAFLLVSCATFLLCLENARTDLDQKTSSIEHDFTQYYKQL